MTLTSNQGKLNHAISSMGYGKAPAANLPAALQVAQLVLKHRQNSNQHQRIVAFVGSPLSLGAEEALKLNKVLRKNNIALDVVSFGAATENDALLETILYGDDPSQQEQHQEGEDASRLLRVFQGQGSVVEAVSSSPIVRGSAAAANGGAGFEFGVDPEMDPELAMALKLSMEEEMQRQTKEKPAEGAGGPEDFADAMEVDAADGEDEDAALQQAIAMSMAKK